MVFSGGPHCTGFGVFFDEISQKEEGGLFLHNTEPKHSRWYFFSAVGSGLKRIGWGYPHRGGGAFSTPSVGENPPKPSGCVWRGYQNGVGRLYPG